MEQFPSEWHVFPTYPAVQDLDQAGFRHFYKNAHTVLMDWSKFRLQSDMVYVNGNFKQRAHNWLEKKEEVEYFGPHMELEWSEFIRHWWHYHEEKEDEEGGGGTFFFDLT